MRTFAFIAACITLAGGAALAPTPASANNYCDPFQNCFRDSDCDQGYCSNRVCQCDSGPPQCTDTCEDRGLESNSPPGGATVHITDCYGIRGALSYCFEPAAPSCAGNEGSSCSPGSNSCGMPGSGTVQCDGSCSGSIPPDSACGSTPVGSHDVSDCTSALGWAFDPDYAGSAQVHIYADGAFAGVATANLSRPDVQGWAAGSGYAPPDRTNSGWSWTVPASLKNGLPHTIRAYGINVNSGGAASGANPQLWSTPKTITCNDVPTGTLASATCGSATGSAADAQGNPVTVVIYDGPSGAGGTQIGVGSAGPNFTIPFAPFTNGQLHTLYAYAQDIPSGTWYQLTNTQGVACPPTVILNATPASVGFAGSTTLSWTVSNAASCTGSPGGWFNPATIAAGSGSNSGSSGPLTGNTTFTLTCTNAVGQSVAVSRVVTVVAPPPTASVVNVSDTNYCTVGPGMVIDWKYESVARPIGAYRVQVLKGATVVFDTGKVPKTALLPHVPTTAQKPGGSPWARILSLGALVLQAFTNR